MEILRFDNAGSTTPQRKKSSKGMLAVGLVATLFGISSAFASSTIQINGDTPIALGQGVTAVTACDTSISVDPLTTMKVIESQPDFYLETITVTNVDTATTVSTTGLGCGGKTFELEIYKTVENLDKTKTTSAYVCSDLNLASARGFVTVSGGTTLSECSGSKIRFNIPESLSGNPVFSIRFSNGPANISYFTLVSSDRTVV
jgi:hypothetical protein